MGSVKPLLNFNKLRVIAKELPRAIRRIFHVKVSLSRDLEALPLLALGNKRFRGNMGWVISGKFKLKDWRVGSISYIYHSCQSKDCYIDVADKTLVEVLDLIDNHKCPIVGE